MLNNSHVSYVSKRKALRGFTLIELVITMAIVGILATVAYPSYSNFITSSNRTEALRELVRVANLQEQFFVDTRGYTADLSQLGVSAGAAYETQSENYTITSAVVGNAYTLSATAQGGQASRDTDCPIITLTDTGARGPAVCWDD